MSEYKFCPHCAKPLTHAKRGGRQRPVCDECEFVRYRNPTIGVAVVLLQDDRILLGRRTANGSCGGQWCIPCGHVEWDEDIRVAAVREFKEETGLVVELGDVIAVHSNFHNPNQHTVGVWFHAKTASGELNPADDLDAAEFFPIATPPAAMAFPTDLLVLDQLRTNHPA